MALRPTLVDALHAPEFEAMLPRLLSYAERRLRRVGWGEGRDRIPAAAEAEELVHSAVVAALEGRRVWPDDMDLATFLEGIMWSDVEHRYSRERRARIRKRELAAAPEDRDAPSDVMHARAELLAAIERTLADDAEFCALFRVMCAGAHKPADRAATLGWTRERERAVHQRMNRRLAAAGLLLEHGDVGQEPLPGGRHNRPPPDPYEKGSGQDS